MILKFAAYTGQIDYAQVGDYVTGAYHLTTQAAAIPANVLNQVTLLPYSTSEMTVVFNTDANDIIQSCF